MTGAVGAPTPAANAVSAAWRVLSATSFGALLLGINTSALDVALPAVARGLHTGPSVANWIVLSYMLVNTILILVFGRVADILGRRRLYQVGLAVFTFAGLAAGFAPSGGVLILMRVVQASAAAAVTTNTTALLVDVFPASLLPLGLGLNATVIAAAQILGPLVGGAVVLLGGWRAAFWFNVPLGVIALGWARVALRGVSGLVAHEPFDWLGTVLAAMAVGGLLVALSEAGISGWGSPGTVLGAACACAFTPLFVSRQRRFRYPLLDVTLVLDRERGMAYLAAFLVSTARFAVVLLMSLYVQTVHGVSALGAGSRVIPLAGGIMLAAPLAGRLAQRHSTRVLCSVGLGLMAVGLVGLGVTLGPEQGVAEPTAWMLLAGIGSGLFLTPNTSSIMAAVPAERRGIANGLRSMLQNTGYAAGAALALAIVTGRLPTDAKKAVYAGTPGTPSAPAELLTAGYRAALLTLAALTVVALAVSLLRGRPRGR